MSRDDGTRGRLLEHGSRQLERGDTRGAIETFRHLLGADPEDAVTHALMAAALANEKRLHAAEHEARAALAVEPDLALGHAVLGVVMRLRGRPREARQHVDHAIALEPREPRHRRALADLERDARRPDEARRILDEALQLDPEDPETEAQIADLEIARGRHGEALGHAREALRLDPDSTVALLTMGRVLLRQGDLDGAREHAIMALRHGATESALVLLGDVKARRSWWLGLWWRWSAWMGELGGRGAIVLLLGAYLLQRAAGIVLFETGHEQAGSAVQLAWLAVVAYTWIGPVLYERMIRAELETVRLSSEF